MQTITVNKNMDYSAPILFLSSYAKATADAAPLGKTEIKQIQKRSAPAALKTSPQQKQSTTIAATPKKVATQPLEKKQEIAKPIEKIEKVVAAVPQKPDVKSEVKPLAEPVKPKPVEKVVAAAPQKPEIKAEVKKDEPKKIESAAKPEPPTPTPSPLAKALDIESNVIPAENIQHAPQITPAIEIPANAQISNNYREVEALRRHAQLQKELVQKWHPPIGVSPDCSCEISFFVNNKGIIEDIKMVKSSNVTMFDISARQALFSMKMPQWTYGNPLVISFKQ
jgi:hypothetical protein